MQRAKTVDGYIKDHPEWADALTKLRDICNSTDLEETIKWGAPCYTIDGKNIVGLAAFKEYAGLWFHQGALLKDPDNVLINAGETKTKALRQWRFTSAKDIKTRTVKAYINEAIANQRAGKAIKPTRNTSAVKVPAELEAAFKSNKKARAAFDALTPGKRREYAAHVAEAKREATRLSRTEKIIPMILSGVGLHDKYRNC